MKRTLSLCCAALLSCLMTCPALAADALLLPPSLYPTEVKEYANGEEMRLKRPTSPLAILSGRAGIIRCWI